MTATYRLLAYLAVILVTVGMAGSAHGMKEAARDVAR